MAATDVAAAISGGGMALRRCCLLLGRLGSGCATSCLEQRAERWPSQRCGMVGCEELFLMMQ